MEQQRLHSGEDLSGSSRLSVSPQSANTILTAHREKSTQGLLFCSQSVGQLLGTATNSVLPWPSYTVPTVTLLPYYLFTLHQRNP